MSRLSFQYHIRSDTTKDKTKEPVVMMSSSVGNDEVHHSLGEDVKDGVVH